jgi:hypothetical protein
MSAQFQIRNLVETKLVGRKIDGLGFVDNLLEVAEQVGDIHCTLAEDRGLRFGIPSQPPFDVQLDAPLGKLRMLCARLGVLCHESGDLDVSLCGGEGIIKKDVSPKQRASVIGSSAQAISLASPPTLKVWKVRFKNTPSEQEFIIHAVRET